MLLNLAGNSSDSAESQGASVSARPVVLPRCSPYCCPGVDFPPRSGHIPGMDFDISHLLDQWEYQPGQVVVRKFRAKDGKEKIQLRVDLGLLQMNAEGRPDGKRPFGQSSLFEHYQARLYKYLAAHGGSAEGFRLKPEDCAKLQ